MTRRMLGSCFDCRFIAFFYFYLFEEKAKSINSQNGKKDEFCYIIKMLMMNYARREADGRPVTFSKDWE